MNFRNESGQRLRAARQAKGLTLQELAGSTGLETSRLSNYEQGTRFMNPDAAKRLARMLGVRASWLMVVDEEDSMTPDELALLQKYRQTDARGRTVIQSVANAQPEVTPPPENDHPTTPPFNKPVKRRVSYR